MSEKRSPASRHQVWDLVPVWMKLGAAGVFLILLSVPVLPWLIGVPTGITAEQPVMDTLPDKGRGAYLEVSDGGTNQLLKLFSWSVQPGSVPEEASQIHPEHFQGIFISQKGLDDPGRYLLFDLDRNATVLLEPEIVSFQTQLRLVPAEPLAPGNYQLAIPTGGMFAGTEYFYFQLDPAVTSLPISADEVTGSAAEPEITLSGPWLEIFPAGAAIISVIAALVMISRLRIRFRAHEAAWIVAFLLFATAATAQLVADIGGWNAGLARLYYLSGATLVVGWLGLGTWLLLVRRNSMRVLGCALVLILNVVALALILSAPVNQQLLAIEGWHALQIPPALTAITMGMNIFGTIILVGGAGWSAWKFRKLGTMRDQMTGCFNLASGALIVAMGGTLTRLGHDQYFYIAVGVGVAVMFAGYMRTIRTPSNRRSTVRPQQLERNAGTVSTSAG